MVAFTCARPWPAPPPVPAEDRDMDALAAGFGVEDFSSMLRWAMRAEAEEAAANRKRSRRGWSKKKAKLRWVASCRRWQGQGQGGEQGRVGGGRSRGGRQLHAGARGLWTGLSCNGWSGGKQTARERACRERCAWVLAAGACRP